MKQLIQCVLIAVIMIVAGDKVYGQACPNGDFENWTLHAFEQPDSGWFNSNSQSLARKDTLTVWRVAGISGQAIHIQTAVVGGDTLQAYIVNTPGDPQSGKGGVPYSEQPTAITGYFRYNLPGNDSAGLWIIFKKAGVVLTNDIIKFRGTGSVSAFTAFSFPLSALSVAPDTVIIAATCSNLFSNVGIESGSWLELDQLRFTGPSVTQIIPGGSFDNWLPLSFDKPSGWSMQANGNSINPISRSATHYSGSYSIKLTSTEGGGGGGNVSPSAITTGYTSEHSGPMGGRPYTLMTDTLTGYYMYAPVGTDTASVMVSLMHTGSSVGGASRMLFAASSWTYFEVPISAFSAPDTMRIDAYSGSWMASAPGSVLYLDYLQLKSQPFPPVSAGNLTQGNMVVYPNPVKDVLNVRLGGMAGKSMSVIIYDLTGKISDVRNFDRAPGVISIPVTQLGSGLYFYEIRSNDIVLKNKFIKE